MNFLEFIIHHFPPVRCWNRKEGFFRAGKRIAGRNIIQSKTDLVKVIAGDFQTEVPLTAKN